MHWILWTLLLFQGHPVDSQGSDASLRTLEAVKRDDIARETAIDEARSNGSKVSAATARRGWAAAQEKLFLDRYNRLMKAMLEFGESYNERHAVDVKLLQAVRNALLDLQKHDAVFRGAEKE